MNLFQSIYCNQYAELKQTGKEAKARKNGIIIISAAVVINIFTLILIIVTFFGHSYLGRLIDHSFRGFGGGRAAGRLIGIILFAVAGCFIYLFFGSESYYVRTITAYEQLPAEAQKRTAKMGAIYLLGSIGLFFVLIMATFFIGK